MAELSQALAALQVSTTLPVYSEPPATLQTSNDVLPVDHDEPLSTTTPSSEVDQSEPLLPAPVISPPIDESEPLAGVDQTTAEPVEIEDVEVVGDHTPLEDAVETAAPSTEAVEEEVSMNNTTSPTFVETIVSPATKPGKQPIGAIKRIIEAKLSPGEQVKRKALAVLIGKTSEAVRQRKENKTLHEWGIRLVPDSETELFERI